MESPAIQRFTTRILRTDGGAWEDSGYFADADSAAQWGQELLASREAVSATVVPIPLERQHRHEGRRKP